MFEFQNYVLYKKARELCTNISKLISNQDEKVHFSDLKNSVYHVLMYISQSSAMMQHKHKLDLLNQAKRSLFETVAILDCLKHSNCINQKTHDFLVEDLNEINKIIFNVSKKMENKSHTKAA